MLSHPALGKTANDCQPAFTNTADMRRQFERVVRQQFQLDFGPDITLKLGPIDVHRVSADLWRLDSTIQLRMAGQLQTHRQGLTGWMTQCSGVTLLKGNTWLADGALSAPRFEYATLPGKGMVLGPPTAEIHVIAFVDSRCEQCHRLIRAAKQLVARGQMRIELRQVAYLEEAAQAVQDTRLGDTALIRANDATVPDAAYLEMLHVFANDDAVDLATPTNQAALDMINTNTATARERLRIDTVPSVLIYEKEFKSYRVMGHWEMNRVFLDEF